MPIDEDPPARHVVEARDQLREGRLARAGGSDERDRLARRYLQVDVVKREYRPAVVALAAPLGIGERDVLEAQLAAQRRQHQCAGALGHARLLVEQLEDLVERGHTSLVGGVQLGELRDRVEEVVERRQEADEDADLEMAVQNLIAAVEQHDHSRDGGDELDCREVCGVQVDRRHVCGPVAVVQLRELVLVARLLCKAPHDPHARQGFLQVAGDPSDRLARAPVGI